MQTVLRETDNSYVGLMLTSVIINRGRPDRKVQSAPSALLEKIITLRAKMPDRHNTKHHTSMHSDLAISNLASAL